MYPSKYPLWYGHEDISDFGMLNYRGITLTAENFYESKPWKAEAYKLLMTCPWFGLSFTPEVGADAPFSERARTEFAVAR